MQIKSNYFIASFISFLIHAAAILYLVGFFYSEKQLRPVLSKPVSVNLIFKEEVKKLAKTITPIVKKAIPQVSIEKIKENKIQFTPEIKSSSISSLMQEDQLLAKNSEESQINIFSNMIVQFIQSAWVKPQNIQSGLICDLRMNVNKNGRIMDVDLIKSSGNIRFDNSAIKAIRRVETFSFFNKIPYNMYQNNFRNIVITFNPSS
jgi:colicin import membrane protein